MDVDWRPFILKSILGIPWIVKAVPTIEFDVTLWNWYKNQSYVYLNLFVGLFVMRYMSWKDIWVQISTLISVIIRNFSNLNIAKENGFWGITFLEASAIFWFRMKLWFFNWYIFSPLKHLGLKYFQIALEISY